MKLTDDARFCPGCGAPQQPAPQPVPQQYVQPVPQQYAQPAYTEPPRKKKGGKLALILVPVALVLVAAIVCLVLFTGGDKTDPTLGRYDAVSCVVSGMELGTEDEWIELKLRGRATLALLGDEYSCKWTLEGDEFTLVQHGDTFTGTLEDGILVIDLGGMVYTYVQQPTEYSPGGHLHEWKDATCLDPRTCVTCGGTEGAPLGHDAPEANYQDPSVCAVCGATVADILEPGMVRHGITQFAELGVTYPYTTLCLNSKEHYTTCELTFTEYRIFESSEEWPAVEGYEYRQLVLEIVASDQNARSYGISPSYNIEDHYDIELLDDTSYYDEEADYSVYSVSYHGELMEVTFWSTYSWSGWKWANDRGMTVNRATTVYTYLVPVGYDGVVLGVRNSGMEIDWDTNPHIYEYYDPENIFLFRLN